MSGKDKDRKVNIIKNVHVCVCTQLCPTLCNPMDCSPQAPLSMAFPRWEYWSGLPFPSLADLPNPGTEAAFPASAGRVFYR